MMQDAKQKAVSYNERELERRFQYHISAAIQASSDARQDGSSISATRCMAHARLALDLAKQANRLDLEQDAQVAIVDFLEMAGRRREAMEARIIAAAMVANLELEYDSPSGTNEGGAHITSVGGVPIEEVTRLLEDDGHEKRVSYSGQQQIPAASEPPKSNESNLMTTSESKEQETLPKAVLEGRQIRDFRGRLAMVLTQEPSLRRKPNFNRY
jgi:hypothetical protein